MTTIRMQKKTQKRKSPVPVPVESVIHTVRRQKVILDTDLARIYDVEIRRLNEQVKRNADRFPDDFMFRLTQEEWEELRRLRSQNATLKRGQHRKYPPLCLHRARGSDGRQHPEEQDGGVHEHLCCPCLYPNARGTHVAA